MFRVLLFGMVADSVKMVERSLLPLKSKLSSELASLSYSSRRKLERRKIAQVWLCFN
jgi:hypothetical protein